MYFTLQILIKADGYDRSTTMHETLDDAEKQFHQNMVSAMNNESYQRAIMMVLDGADGSIKFRRVWNRG